MIYPGPASLPPGLKPGGVVLRLYTPLGVNLLEQRLGPHDDIDQAATLGRALVDDQIDEGDPVVIVCYDGDTGERTTYGIPPGLVSPLPG